MKFLFTTIVTVAIGLSAFAGANPVQQSAWTTNTAGNLPSISGTGGNTLTASSASFGQLNINMGSGTLNGSTVSVGNLSGNGSGITGINAANVSGTFTGNGGGLTNITFGLDAVVVMPWINQPASVTNSSRYFGPWLGSNYVQLAINSLNTSSNLYAVGGGKIIVLGTNYFANPLTPYFAVTYSTNTISGAGTAGVNGYYTPFNTNAQAYASGPNGYFMAGLSQSANSYPLEIDDTNLNTLYFSTNGITWYTNNITTGAGPPPTGSYSTIYTASILSLAMESPAFSQGALVCATNPCIRLLQTNDINSLSLKNLIISSLDNSPTNLMEVSVGYPRLSIESCWFGNWKQITNHATVFGQAGLTTTATDAGGGPHNLQIFIQGAVSDKCFMKDNIFLGISDIWVNQDHLDFIGNQFSFCGNRSGGVVANGWPTNSPQYNGAVLLLKHQVDDNWNFRDNLFYQCTAAYYKEDSANQTKSYNDYFEGGIYSVLYSNTIAPINFVEINPAAAQGLGVPGTATVTNNTVFGTTNLPEQVLLNAQVALFPGSISVAGTNFGNGAGLTNLNAANLTGTVPQGVLPGTVVTNNATGLTLSGTFSGNGSGLTNLSAGSLVGAATSFTLTNMASAGASAANTGHFWPSNTALYWVTPTKTNYITGP